MEEPLERAAARQPGARRRGTRRPGRRPVPQDVTREIAASVDPAAADRVERRLAAAAEAFEHDRPQDAYRIVRQVLPLAGHVPTARELAGLSLYRLGRWSEAAKQLEAFRELTGSVEQYPVLADSYRALGRFRKVDELWTELREASPHPAIVTEGRIVAAGALADQGRVRDAIRLLERARPNVRGAPADHHLRLWYALADLYERTGDLPRARALFGRVAAAEPAFADTAERLANLG